jgi:hypothetical protein
MNLSIQDIDRLSMLFEPDELAAHEYRRTFQRRPPLAPEKRLMLAVLEDAIFCFQRYIHVKGGKEKKLHDDTVSWIFDRSDTSVFSFENICDTCGLDPDYLRIGLLSWQRQRKSNQNSYGNASPGAKRSARQWGMRGHKG